MIKKRKNEKGITLVALTITIVIMAILISVVVRTTVDEELIDTAMNATDKYEQTLISQAINAIFINERSLYENGFITENEMWMNIKESIESNEELAKYGTITVTQNTKTGTEEIISLSIQVGDYFCSIINDNIQEGIGAIEVAKSPKEYYGKTVNNYTAGNSSVTTWEIFYSDGDNIYLIAEDYIPKGVAPSKNGTTPNKDTSSDYELYFSDLVYKYAGATDIGTNNPARKWLSYLETEKGKEDWRYNMRVVAYLLDTEIWKGFAGEKAEYAIGAPTLDLFVASYNCLYDTPLSFITSDREDEYGYRIKLEGDVYYTYYRGGIEIGSPCIVDSTKAEKMWIASVSAHTGANHIMSARKEETGGAVYDTRYDEKTCGLRPVVCLKENTRLQKELDGSYSIR